MYIYSNNITRIIPSLIILVSTYTRETTCLYQTEAGENTSTR